MLPHRRSTSRGCGPLEVDRYKPVRGSVTYSYGLWQRNPHRSPACESDAWPFCADPVLFEARRAVGQAVRTTFDFLPSDAVASGVLKYIVIAKAIEESCTIPTLPLRRDSEIIRPRIGGTSRRWSAKW